MVAASCASAFVALWLRVTPLFHRLIAFPSPTRPVQDPHIVPVHTAGMADALPRFTNRRSGHLSRRVRPLL